MYTSFDLSKAPFPSHPFTLCRTFKLGPPGKKKILFCTVLVSKRQVVTKVEQRGVTIERVGWQTPNKLTHPPKPSRERECVWVDPVVGSTEDRSRLEESRAQCGERERAEQSESTPFDGRTYPGHI